MFIDQYIFPGIKCTHSYSSDSFYFMLISEQLFLSVLVPGLIGLCSLIVLRISSTLHGGVVTDSSPGTVGFWPGWYFTYWLVNERRERGRRGVNSSRDKCLEEEVDRLSSQEMELFMRI